MNEYIKISYQGGYCLASSKKEAAIIIENEILEDLENIEKGEAVEITIEKVLVSDKELSEAGEFDGFY